MRVYNLRQGRRDIVLRRGRSILRGDMGSGDGINRLREFEGVIRRQGIMSVINIGLCEGSIAHGGGESILAIIFVVVDKKLLTFVAAKVQS